jgi:type VI secretion system protein ImpM
LEKLWQALVGSPATTLLPAVAQASDAVAPAKPGVGVFGKLPTLGDFLTRGLPAAFTEPWHAWLVRGLGEARRILGDRFEPAYMAAPVWRFSLPPGVAGRDGVLGVLLPSVDAANRSFPLTLAATRTGASIAEPSAWFDRLETEGRAALAENLHIDTWLAGLAALAPPTSASSSYLPGEWHRRAAADADPHTCARELMAELAIDDLSVFWSAGSPFVEAGCLAGRGLPEGADFARLLNGAMASLV